MAREDRGMLRGIAEHQQRLIAGMDGKHGVAGRVAGRRQCDDARRHLLAGVEAGHLRRDVGENPALIEEREFQVRRRRVQVGVVHPVGPLRRRHHDLGIGKNQRVVLVLDAVDVIGMEMRNDDLVDGLRRNAGGGEIVADHAGGGRNLAAGAGVDQDELLAGIDDEGREWRLELVVRHVGRVQRMLDFSEGGVADEFVGDRPIPDAVIQCGQLERSDFVAIDARGLLARWRRFGGCRFGAGKKRHGRGAGEQRAAGQCRHDDLTPKTWSLFPRQSKHGNIAMMKKGLAAVSIGMAALAFAAGHAPAHAQSADVVLCDRLAADPTDPDKPADVKGTSAIAPSDIPTAIKFCKTASGASRRTLFELGRAYAASGQLAAAVAAYRKAADKGSTAAMVELGLLYANGTGVAKDQDQARKLFERAAAGGNPRGATSLAALFTERRHAVRSRRGEGYAGKSR